MSFAVTLYFSTQSISELEDAVNIIQLCVCNTTNTDTVAIKNLPVQKGVWLLNAH